MQEVNFSREEEKFKIIFSLTDQIFDQLDQVSQYFKNEESKRNLQDINLLTRKMAFHYTESFLNQLIEEKEKEWGAHSPEERLNLQRSLQQVYMARHRVHESLEINFRIIGRLLTREGITVPWFKNNDLASFSDKQRVKVLSAQYALKLAHRFQELKNKDLRTQEENLEFGRIISTIDKSDLESVLKKFNQLPEIYKQDLINFLQLK